MGVFDQLFALRAARHVRQLAAEIAHRCWPNIQPRLGPMMLQMSPAEARGYVRAHSSPLVRSSVDAALLADPALGEWAREELIAQALETIIQKSAAITVEQRRTLQPVRQAA